MDARQFIQPWRDSYFAGQPLQIGDQVQFLFDDYIVEDRFGLKRVIGPIEKHADNPLDTGPAMPWESYRPVLSSVLFDPEENIYKAWYDTMRWQEGIETGYSYSSCYAESRDGIRWTKPRLGFFSWGEYKKTNLVLHKDKGTASFKGGVTLNPEAVDPQQRFTALAKMVPPGETVRCLVLMHSPDGREWNLAPDPILFRGASDGSYSLVHNPERNCWMLYRRPPTHALIGYGAEGFYHGANDKRRVSVALSEDMKHWTHPRTLALPDEIDVSDIDSVKVIRHGNGFLGFIGLMPNNSPEVPKHTHLMWSRDGFVWERLPNRPAFVPNGAVGEWDEGSISVHGSMIPAGDRVHMYYVGVNVSQFEDRLPHVTGTGLAFMDRDRWVGQQAGAEGGYLLTRQFIMPGAAIEVNCLSSVQRPPKGLAPVLKAELLQPAVEHLPAEPYQGYSLADCDPVTVTNQFDQPLSWKGSTDVTPLRGLPVYIRFYLRSAALYTFRCK